MKLTKNQSGQSVTTIPSNIVNATVRRDQALRHQGWRYDHWVYTFNNAINDSANMGQTKVVATYHTAVARTEDLWLQKALNDFVRAGFNVTTTVDPYNYYYTTITFEW